jgi:hypothetical protein
MGKIRWNDGGGGGVDWKVGEEKEKWNDWTGKVEGYQD